MNTIPQSKQDNSKSSEQSAFSAPTISLPKGGGAIRGIGEKFAANPVTGTGSMSVPIATSPGRSGFGPQLSLSYDSGSGNGPFGFGWSLSLPSITRKTDKGLPKYQDAEDSDVFILSGAEDLVPEYKKDEDGNWILQNDNYVIWEESRAIGSDTYMVRRYRPRVEGLFARIERWTNIQTGEIHWRSISRDNITTLYGKDNYSRIFDPAELDIDDSADLEKPQPKRIFSWLICQSYDDKGNAIIYDYIQEDEVNVDLTQANERNRVRTANRYLKRIKYGNRKPNLDSTSLQATDPTELDNDTWMFEVVFDYEEGHYTEDAADAEERVFASALIETPDGTAWPVRRDPFSSYRASFEVRTCRLCHRVLMFHHFPEELKIDDCLVRSTEFTYDESPIASFITGVTQSGFVHQPTASQANRYLKRSLPPVEFEYSKVPTPEELAQQPIHEVDTESLENLPIGLDGAIYQWIDLDGEGTSGILTEQGSGWYYKRNLSANNLVPENGHERAVARLGPVELITKKPAPGLNGDTQFLDLAGDGQVDLAQIEGPVRGFYERTKDASNWAPFEAFDSWPDVNTRDPNLRFVDLTGDGHADILVTESEALTWYPSLAEAGFGPSVRVSLPLDEEKGPRLVFANGDESIYLADLSGDGLTDLVRIRNGEVCYWPNLGYGHFGAKVTMDNAPWFDSQDQFDQRRIRLADTDGSGTTDIFYLGRSGVRVYFNQSGNGWSAAVTLPQFPPVDTISSVQALDLLGNGTACLVWSSPLPGAIQRPMYYIALMETKPHLLIVTKNNLGAETRVHYAPSTKFYLDDKRASKPWITRLPFVVHLVEKVEIYDHISRNRFVSCSTYHHGYFDGVEREFRGFGLVEQTDTEEFAALSAGGALPTGENVDAASHVPPVLTKTWFHTGAYLGRKHISDFFAGLLDDKDQGEYYRELPLNDDESEEPLDEWSKELLLEDTTLPPGLTAEEERQACRALKGAMLRQEVYALDSTEKEKHPYSVTEQNFTIQRLQPQGDNPFGVFFTHAREAISYHYERNPADPRIQHALTLEVDEFGDVLKEVAIGYGRRQQIRVVDENGEISQISNPDPDDLDPMDREKQTRTLIVYTENRVTNPIDNPDDYRAPLPAETRTYELTGFKPENDPMRFSFEEWTENNFNLATSAVEIPYEQQPDHMSQQKRLIEHVRSLYRKDDLTALLPLGELHSLALPGESYQLAFTPGLLSHVYRRPLDAIQPPGAPPPGNLLPDLAGVLGGKGGDQGGYVSSEMLRSQNLFPVNVSDGQWTLSDEDGHWWIPSGRVFLSTKTDDTAAEELTFARQHFFLPHRYRDSFHTDTFNTESKVAFDDHILLIEKTVDALGNRAKAQNDYRVLSPYLMTDPNDNRVAVAFDALGMVAGTAVMGKESEPDGKPKGDLLDEFEPDLTQDQLERFINKPREAGANLNESVATEIVHELLGKATTRIVYDLDRYKRLNEPPFAATIARETHVSDLPTDQRSKLQVSISYSDGFSQEIQKKIQAEPGPVPQRDAEGNIIVGENGQALLTGEDVSPRWVGSGWTVYNNKGKPVRQYEPFFTDRHSFEFDVRIGVSPVLFYDPVERVVATLHPNHTWEKVVFDPWQQTTYDVNDTVTSEPQTDPDVSDFFMRLPDVEYIPTWHALRTDPAHAAEFAQHYPVPVDRANETTVAHKTEAHAGTPTIAYFDTLGRPFLTVVHNKTVCPGHKLHGTEDRFHTRVDLDIEGNLRAVHDERRLPENGLPVGVLERRIVMRYDYDMLGNHIHQASMEAGERWMLNDVTGNPIRAWDSRSHEFQTAYDELRRSVDTYLLTDGTPEKIKIGRTIYGESALNPETNNLRGKVVQFFDQAGLVTSDEYDFKGNLLHGQRQLARNYKTALNWMGAEPLEAEKFTSQTRYDALNRPIQMIAPHSDQPDAKINVIQPFYNEANLLEQINAWLNQDTEPTELLDLTTANLPAVKDLDYDAKGQRILVDYGNGVRTTYEYDPLTFRLRHLLTRRNATSFPDDCPEPPPQVWPGCQMQNLHYTYDPVGNITHIRDDAQQTIFFRNRRVEPRSKYIYDAVYRLIEATGREHLGQTGGQRNPPTPPDAFNAFHMHQDHPGNGKAMGTYIERYVYDSVGNFEMMQHHGVDPAHPGWTRTYTYEEHSQLEPGKLSNRLTSTSIGAEIERYSQDGDGYDPHGNMLNMPHLSLLQWDYDDQLQSTSQQNTNNGVTPEITYYVYDVTGQRVRKVTERQVPAEATPSRKKERIYLGGFEIFREYRNDGEITDLERETLHIMDDQQRIALVETRTKGDDDSTEHLIRYQLGNHLGSASLELNHQAQVISYEEYYPYGTTSYQAVQSQTETGKRYRYTGMERDEESGLSYHGARYYAPWLVKWTTCDPAGIVDGINLYSFVMSNPVALIDTSGMESEDRDLEIKKVQRQREIDKVELATAKARLKALEAKDSTDPRELDEARHAVYIAQRNWNKSLIELNQLSTPQGRYQWAKSKEENDERYKRLTELREILVAQWAPKEQIRSVVRKIGDEEVLKHYGYDPDKSVKSNEFRQMVIEAITAYHAEYGGFQVRVHELTDDDKKARKEAEKKIERDRAIIQTHGAVVVSFWAALAAGIASLFTDDPETQRAAAGGTAALANAGETAAGGRLPQNKYTPRIKGGKPVEMKGGSNSAVKSPVNLSRRQIKKYNNTQTGNARRTPRGR